MMTTLIGVVLQQMDRQMLEIMEQYLLFHYGGGLSKINNQKVYP